MNNVVLNWLFMVSMVRMPRDTLAGEELGSNQKDTQDRATSRQLGT